MVESANDQAADEDDLELVALVVVVLVAVAEVLAPRVGVVAGVLGRVALSMSPRRRPGAAPIGAVTARDAARPKRSCWPEVSVARVTVAGFASGATR